MNYFYNATSYIEADGKLKPIGHHSGIYEGTRNVVKTFEEMVNALRRAHGGQLVINEFHKV